MILTLSLTKASQTTFSLSSGGRLDWSFLKASLTVPQKATEFISSCLVPE